MSKVVEHDNVQLADLTLQPIFKFCKSLTFDGHVLLLL
jgi:hypothetical protein